MAVYDNVPLIELEGVLQRYASSWGTIVFVGIAIREGDKFFPVGMQIWSRDETNEETAVYGPPDLPDALRMYRVAKAPLAATNFIGQIFGQGSIQIAGVQVDYRHCAFGRAAFLGSRDYDYLYAKELNARVRGWPKLLLEGGIQNRQELEKQIQSTEQELGKTEYKFHTLRDASNHLLDFPFSPGYYMGGISGVLRIPVRVNAKVDGQTLGYNLGLHKALKQLPKDLRYVARSDKGDRDEALSLPEGKEEAELIQYSSTATVQPGDRVVEVTVALDGRRVDSARIPEEKESPAKAAPEKVSELPREGKVFIVHGRNHDIRDKIVSYLTKDLGFNQDWIEVLELEPFIGRTLAEKFEDVAARCRFAVIILSADDALWRFPNLKRTRRARQNVILELGFFWGRLGRKNLAFLADPHVDIPSDLKGVGYITLTPDLAKTKLDLLSELRAAGLVNLTT